MDDVSICGTVTSPRREYCLHSSKLMCLLDQTVSFTDQQILKDHLRNCPVCNDKYMKLQKMVSQVAHVIPNKKPNRSTLETIHGEWHGMLAKLSFEEDKRYFWEKREFGRQMKGFWKITISKEMLCLYVAIGILCVFSHINR